MQQAVTQSYSNVQDPEPPNVCDDANAPDTDLSVMDGVIDDPYEVDPTDQEFIDPSPALATRLRAPDDSTADQLAATTEQQDEDETEADDLDSFSNQDPEQLPLSYLVRRLYEGELNPKHISARRRRECISHLSLQGHSVSEIARILNISDRTVHRDRAAIRRQQSIKPNLELADQLLGEFQQITMAAIGRLSRLSRRSDTPPYVRLWAEQAIVAIYQRFFDSARRLGYLEDAERRMRHLRAVDPEEQARCKDELAAFDKMLGGDMSAWAEVRKQVKAQQVGMRDEQK